MSSVVVVCSDINIKTWQKGTSVAPVALAGKRADGVDAGSIGGAASSAAHAFVYVDGAGGSLIARALPPGSSSA